MVGPLFAALCLAACLLAPAWQAHLAGVLAAIVALRAGLGRAGASTQDARIMRVTADPALPIRTQP